MLAKLQPLLIEFTLGETFRETLLTTLHHLQVDIGKREIVGFGYNGEESYLDDVSYPFPAIRFREDTAEISVRNEESIYL